MIRIAIPLYVSFLVVVSFVRASISFPGADHSKAPYTWERSLVEWNAIETIKESETSTWMWVPLNVPNPPGDLSHGGLHEDWGWYQVKK